MVGGIIRPAPAVVVERPVDGSWALAAWSLGEGPGSEPKLTSAPRMHRWTGAEDWEVVLPTADGPVTLQRRQGRVEVQHRRPAHRSLELEPGPDVSRRGPTSVLPCSRPQRKVRRGGNVGMVPRKVTLVLLVALVLNAISGARLRRYRLAWRSPLVFVLTAGWLLVSYYFIFVRAQLV